MKWSHAFLSWALCVSGLAAAEPVDADSPWEDLPKAAGVHTLVKRVPNPEPPRPKGARAGRGLLMPPLWHLGHGQLRLRQEADPKTEGTEFLFDDKGRVFVMVRWREEFEEKALNELAKVGGVVAEPKQEIRFEEKSGHLPGDFRQLDEGKTVVVRGCFVPPKRILELMDQPVIRYIKMTKAKR